MRTTIDIDENLMDEAMRITGLRTKRATVEAALRQLVRIEQGKAMRSLFGELEWEGDLDAMRRSR